MDYFAAVDRSMARLQSAQSAQLAALSRQRLGALTAVPQLSMPMDTVTLGAPGLDTGLIPNPSKLAQALEFNPGPAPLSSDPNYWEKQNAYYDKVLQHIAILKALEAAQGAGKTDDGSTAKKGDLNVVAGNRKDGVKAKKVTIHEHRKWGTRQWDENRADYRAHESKFENAQVGKTYQVNVEWEDGTITTRNVEMESPGQTVHIDTEY